MSEPTRSPVDSQTKEYDEPVFQAATPPVDEPFFAPADGRPSDPTEPPEPVFEPVPTQARGVTLPVDAPHVATGWDAPEVETPVTRATPRRLGRTPPRWAILGAVAVLALGVLWFAVGGRTPDEPLLPTIPAAGVVGSIVLSDGEGGEPALEATPAPAADVVDTRLAPGVGVVVGNTNGQGIRLRSTPGTGALTLGIYNDGAPFVVLAPGGDYAGYPVEADGYFWYRIRVTEDPADQLVGWAAGDFLLNRDQ